MAKTYKEWEDEAKKSGLYDTFSSKDLDIIKTDTAYGDRQLDRKKQYNAATTQEEKNKIADEANYERLNYGYYNTVEGDGNGGYVARSHTLDDISSGKSTKSGVAIAQPTTKYSSVNRLISEIAGDKFTYDPREDKRYRLSEEFAQKAMANQMAESALLTGGYGNSYAAHAGQQVYSDVMREAESDLEADAYARWAAERDNKYNLLGIARDIEQQEYERAWNEEQRAYERKLYEQQRQDAIDQGERELLLSLSELEQKNTDAATKAAAESIMAHIEAYGTVEGIPAELIAKSGLDETRLYALAEVTRRKLASENAEETRKENESRADIAKIYADIEKGKKKDDEEDESPFDLSKPFAYLDEKGATKDNAVDYLMAAGYKEDQADAIASLYSPAEGTVGDIESQISDIMAGVTGIASLANASAKAYNTLLDAINAGKITSTKAAELIKKYNIVTT